MAFALGMIGGVSGGAAVVVALLLHARWQDRMEDERRSREIRERMGPER